MSFLIKDFNLYIFKAFLTSEFIFLASFFTVKSADSFLEIYI